MALYGQINEFVPGDESIQDYLERLEFYLEANGVNDDSKKRAILLTVIGAKQFRLLKDLVFPNTPGSKSFQDLCSLLKNHHAPPPPKFLQRARFDARNRQVNETVSEYIASLQHLSEYCEFGDSLNDRLIEKFVTGINHIEIQRKLLLEQNLTLDKAIKIATSVLQTSEATRALVPLVSQPNVNVVNQHSRPQKHASTIPRKQVVNHNSHQIAKQSNHNKCYRCLGPHSPNQCKFKSATCFKCSKSGHISKACRSSQTPASHSYQNNSRGGRHHQRQNFLGVEAYHSYSNDDNSAVLSASSDPEFHLFRVTSAQCVDPINVPMLVNDVPVTFQLDTGATLTVINEADFESCNTSNVKLQPSNKQLRTYTGGCVPIMGETMVLVNYNNQVLNLPIVVVKGNAPSLVGRNWLKNLKLDWSSIFAVKCASDRDSVLSSLDNVLHQNENVFGEGGLLNDRTVNIALKEGTNPKYCKARVPPYALRTKIEQEIERLESSGIIERVESSNWATPIVPVAKRDGTVRLCGDYKVTLNKHIEPNGYPIPNIEDISMKLGKGEKFTELDFSHAYTQLALDPESKKYTTINTHKGTYQYSRLCFGISSSPGIFQAVMDNIFQDIPNVCIYFDNVYITGENDTEHLQTLDRVLKMIRDKGLKINKNKCQFMLPEIKFLGYRLNKQGLKPQYEKIKAIKEAPRPQNVQQLRAFLGMINYYAKFVKMLSDSLTDLYKLLQKNVPWQWKKEQEDAFLSAKNVLTSEVMLVHYDPDKKLTLTCDASPYGVGAVLSHQDESGEWPIAYASRTLNKAEQNYAQLDREGLSIIFGIKKFHKFLFGRPFTIITDHRPLLGLFGEHKPLPEHASLRVQRWAIILAAYDYKLLYKPGCENSADALSRLPLDDDTHNSNYVPEEIEALFSIIDNSVVDAERVAKETQQDAILSKIYEYCWHGWPEDIHTMHENMKPFKNRQFELSLEDGCILWGSRVIIPSSLQNDVLTLLHEAHLGASKMKSLARSWFWWPYMDADIEKFVKICSSCAKHAKKPAKAPLHNWDWPTEPWSRIHIDYAGPFMNSMFLIVIDAHSKWLEVKQMNTITTSNTISELKEIFSYHGLPDQIVSDNGPSLTSNEFRLFCSSNGIQHITTSPYMPSTNGLAERAVGIFKTAMVKMGDKFTIKDKLNRFLTKYRVTPHVTTGVAPCELLCGRKLKTHLDLIHPIVHNSVLKHQQAQKYHHDKRAIEREMRVNDSVYFRNYGRGDKWLPGQITECTGPVSYRVRSNDGVEVRRHADQIRVTCSDPKTADKLIQIQPSEPPDCDHNTHRQVRVGSTANDGVNKPFEFESLVPTPAPSDVDTIVAPTPLLNNPIRRSMRAIKPPDKLNL